MGRLVPKTVDVRRKQTCVSVIKALLKICCSNYKGYFQFTSHRITTRNIGYMVQLPKVRLEFGRRSFRFEGAKNYNRLTLELRKENNLLVFNRLFNVYRNVLL